LFLNGNVLKVYRCWILSFWWTR